jgi:uncharacterized delta-60 repeat protein
VPVRTRAPRIVRAPFLILMLSAVALVAPSAAAAHGPGALDQSFSNDGFTLVDFGGYAEPMEIFPADGGGFTVVGRRHPTDYRRQAQYRLALARFGADGNLDATFGTNGRSTIDPGFRGFDGARGWDQAPNGDMVVVGSPGRDEGYYLMRLKSDGRRARTFGDDGMVVWATSDEWVSTDVRWLLDGRILVLGWSKTYSEIRAHNPDGSVDTTFGDGGAVRFSGQFASDLFVQSGGRLLVTGFNNEDRLVVRAFHLDGRPDHSFGYLGRAMSGRLVSSGYLWSGGANVMGNGEIVAVGTTIFGGDSRLFLVRFTPDGELDSSLGNGTGREYLPVPEYSLPYGVAELPGDRLAIVGNLPKRSYDDDSRDPRKVYVTAANHDGTMWGEFAEGGYFASYFGRRHETNTGTAAAVINGDLVVAGTADLYLGDAAQWLVARFHLD